MIISVKVHPGSSKEKVVKKDKNNYEVWTYQPAIKNRTNKRLIELLSKYFDIPELSISINKGMKSKNKSVIIHKYL